MFRKKSEEIEVRRIYRKLAPMIVADAAAQGIKLDYSVDSLKLAKIISEEAINQGLKQKILLQINNAEEEQKSRRSNHLRLQTILQSCSNQDFMALTQK